MNRALTALVALTISLPLAGCYDPVAEQTAALKAYEEQMNDLQVRVDDLESLPSVQPLPDDIQEVAIVEPEPGPEPLPVDEEPEPIEDNPEPIEEEPCVPVFRIVTCD